MNEKLISVIIPTYNRQKVVSNAIESVIKQDYKEIEIIVIDDGSTDNTREIISKYSQVKYIFQKNKGASNARNQAVKIAQGYWIAFLDSDDIWHDKSKLTQQISCLTYNNKKICHSDEIWIRNGVRVNPMKKHLKSGGDLFYRSLKLCVISLSTVIIERNLFLSLGGFDESLPACEDYDLWLRATANNQIALIDKKLSTRISGNADQLSCKYEAMDRFRIKTLIKLIDNNILNIEQLARTKEILQEKLNILILGAIKRNKFSDAQKYKEIQNNYCISSKM